MFASRHTPTALKEALGVGPDMMLVAGYDLRCVAPSPLSLDVENAPLRVEPKSQIIDPKHLPPNQPPLTHRVHPRSHAAIRTPKPTERAIFEQIFRESWVRLNFLAQVMQVRSAKAFRLLQDVVRRQSRKQERFKGTLADVPRIVERTNAPWPWRHFRR